MLGFGFGVRRIPPTLPDIVFALFSGLNSAAVGLIAVAAYDLSAKVITDPLTRIAVLLSAALSTCYESQWLYPVMMVAGGTTTFLWDSFVQWKERRAAAEMRRETQAAGSRQSSPRNSSSSSPAAVGSQDMQDIEMHPTAPSPAVNNVENSLPVLNSGFTGLSQKRPVDNKDTGNAQVTTTPEESELTPVSAYFKLSITEGLVM